MPTTYDPVMSDDEVITYWACDMPAEGARFRVLDDEWDQEAEPAVRTIHRIELEHVGEADVN